MHTGGLINPCKKEDQEIEVSCVNEARINLGL
jgi:hypothetical protein